MEAWSVGVGALAAAVERAYAIASGCSCGQCRVSFFKSQIFGLAEDLLEANSAHEGGCSPPSPPPVRPPLGFGVSNNILNIVAPHYINRWSIMSKPCLVHAKNKTFFKILHHIKSCVTCMEY